MNSHVHRWHTEPSASRGASSSTDVDLVVVAVAFWAISLARVLGAAIRRETFGAESTLALLAVLAIPWIVLRHGRRKGRS